MHIFYFFGDSITLGVNVLPKDSYVHLLIDKITEKYDVPPSKFYNLGACKNSSKEILARFDNEFSVRNLPGSTPVFTLMCGVVDTMKFTENPYLGTEESKENFRKILQKAIEYGTVFAISPSPVKNEEQNERIARLILEQEKICGEMNVPYINIFADLYDSEYINDLKDGVHPSEHGNMLIAKKILAELDRYL